MAHTLQALPLDKPLSPLEAPTGDLEVFLGRQLLQRPEILAKNSRFSASLGELPMTLLVLIQFAVVKAQLTV